jgi:hypothetical protein
MPARDLVTYCAACDANRLGIADGADTDAERAELLAQHPRVLATKTDVDGTPLCAQCLEYEREERRLEHRLKTAED